MSPTAITEKVCKYFLTKNLGFLKKEAKAFPKINSKFLRIFLKAILENFNLGHFLRQNKFVTMFLKVILKFLP